jgi:hypothetical protein
VRFRRNNGFAVVWRPCSARVSDGVEDGNLPFGGCSESDQGHQCTGLSACCSRYGLVAEARRLRPVILRPYAQLTWAP